MLYPLSQLNLIPPPIPAEVPPVGPPEVPPVEPLEVPAEGPPDWLEVSFASWNEPCGNRLGTLQRISTKNKINI